MAKTVAATALEAFEWNGRSFYPGEAIPNLPVVDALVLLRKRAIHVPLTRKAKPPEDAEAPAVEKMPVSRSRRRYRRSDMRAETTAGEVLPLKPGESVPDVPVVTSTMFTQDLTPDDEAS